MTIEATDEWWERFKSDMTDVERRELFSDVMELMKDDVLSEPKAREILG